MGRLAIDRLVEDQAVSVRKKLACGLAFGFPDGDPVCVRLLGTLSKDRAAAVRAEMARALGVAKAHNNPDLKCVMHRLCDDKSPEVREQLLEGLLVQSWDLDEEGRSLVEALKG